MQISRLQRHCFDGRLYILTISIMIFADYSVFFSRCSHIDSDSVNINYCFCIFSNFTIVSRHKYVELLCIKCEANIIGTGTNGSVDNAVEEVVKVLSDLEKFAPTKDEYSSLCLLLTLPRLTDHLQYKEWNPSNARVQCFREVYPLVEKFLPGDRKSSDPNHPFTVAKNDRLIQLIIKGILYESCVNYCQAKATGSKESEQVIICNITKRMVCKFLLGYTSNRI